MSQPIRPRQNEKVRQAILGAAFSLVGEVGYDKLTIEGMAKRAGAGKQTIYRWWPSKAHVLLEALVERVQDDLVFENTGDLRKDMIAQIERAAKIMINDDTRCPFIGLLVEAQFDEQVSAAMNAQIYEPTYRAAAERIAIGQKEGQLNPSLDPVMVVELLYAPLYYRLIVPFVTIDIAKIPVFFDMTFSGLRPSKDG
jgi:AcrR family transcriptional regulator